MAFKGTKSGLASLWNWWEGEESKWSKGRENFMSVADYAARQRRTARKRWWLSPFSVANAQDE